MEQQPLTPESAQQVELPSWLHPFRRDVAIREHLGSLGIETIPKRYGCWYMLRCELVTAVEAYYDRFADQPQVADDASSKQQQR